jgi:hypothetical protein
MNDPTNASLPARARDQLRRLRQLQKVNCLLLGLSLIGIFGGLAAGLWSQLLGIVMMMTGFAVVGVLLIESYTVYPRLLCPRCHRRFFLPERNWHWLARISPTQQRCLHCGLSIHEVS